MALFAHALLLAVLQAPPAQASKLPVRVPYLWDAWLDSPGGPIEFQLGVTGSADNLQFKLINGANQADATRIERWERTKDGVALHIDSYDSHLGIESLNADGTFEGKWRKRRSAEQWTELALHGRRSKDMLPDAHYPGGLSYPQDLDGRWLVQFASEKEPAVGVFSWPWFNQIAGTFLTTLGDYRFLAGGYDLQRKRWHLSCFDGAHAFLFTAKLEPDGSVSGDFWSGDTWHETWTAKRDDNASLPDPFGLTRGNADVDLAKLSFMGLDGAKLSLADPKFAGKARIVQLFGTWCPNCNDEAEFLRELDQRYRKQGLSIVGLGFELTGDQARDLGQLRLFAQRHQLEYPLLLAGKSDKLEATKAFPLLDQVRAFPTTVFLRADGSVRAVHQGYSGPATGAEHQKLRLDFDRLIQDLLGDRGARQR